MSNEKDTELSSINHDEDAASEDDPSKLSNNKMEGLLDCNTDTDILKKEQHKVDSTGCIQMSESHPQNDMISHESPKEDEKSDLSVCSKQDTSNKDDTDTDDDPPDGGARAWMVCLASCYSFGALSAVINTFGIRYVDLLEEFKDEGGDIAFKTAWIGSLNVSLTFFFSFMSSTLVNMFGVQIVSGVGVVLAVSGLLGSSFARSLGLMYFTYGILLGIGGSMIFIPASVILPEYFKRHLGKVNGIMTFGGAVFTIGNAFALPAMTKALGFRNAMRIETVMMALVGLAPIVWKPRISKSRKTKKNIKKILCGQGCSLNICQNKNYLVWIIALGFGMMGYFIPFTHLVNYSEQKFPGSPGNIMIMCIGGVTGISRLILGHVADHPAIKPNWIFQTASVLLAFCTCFVTLAPNFGVLVFIAVMMGICDGGVVSMVNPTVYNILKGQGVVQGIGVAWTMIGGALLCGPPLAGLIYDKMKTYQLVFLIGAIPMLVGPTLMFLMPSELRTKSKL